MADTGQRIAALRAYVVDGQGGADYMDRDENHWIVQQIATPMSIYPPYKATRTSFGINALKTLVIELEADDGTVGFGITTGGLSCSMAGCESSKPLRSRQKSRRN